MVGKTTAEMQTQATFTAAGWDFLGESANGSLETWRMCTDGVDYARLTANFGALAILYAATAWRPAI
jgi:hypothetical protein